MESPSSAPEDDYMPTFYVGQHESRRPLTVSDQVLRQAQDCNYNMLTTPISTPHFQSRVIAQLSNHLEVLRSHSSLSPAIVPELSPVDTPLTPGEVISHLLAVSSPWIDLCSPDPLVYNISRQVLNLEIAYAAFCGIGNVIIPGPKLHHRSLHGEGVTQYAYAIQEALAIGNYIQIQIWLPMIDHLDTDDENVEGSLMLFAREEYVGAEEESKSRKADIFGTWDAWNIIRSVCKHNARLFIALSIPRHLPPLSIQSRWHSEPLRLISFSGQSFVQKIPGYPVLSKHHRELISKYMRIRNPPWILLCDVGPIPGLIPGPDNSDSRVSTAVGFISPSATMDAPTPAEAAQQKQTSSKKPDDPTPQLSYIRSLQHKQPPRTILERFGAGYQDYLQAPLQPLTDNLESITYEVFEKDPVKYNQYEKALAQALSDWVQQGKPASGPNGRIVVAIVGAGRGPLVTRALRASETTGVEIELWAVEKNPNAYVLLQQHNVHTWHHRVNLVKSDMRSWKGPVPPTAHDDPGSPAPAPTPYPIDILISELLGSFADNELSPECLDGILPLLNPTHGLSIPCSYTAYLTPIAAPKLHADIAARAPSDPSAPNTPYVVMLHAIDFLSTTSPAAASPSDPTPHPTPNILPTWSFTHGPQAALAVTSQNEHNARHTRLTFRTRDRGVCHGLAGYFEAVLYPGTELSTNPLTMEAKSAGMMSWFPIFFPLKTPLYHPDHTDLTISLWRATDNRKVWYEWVVESYGWNVLVSGEKKRIRLGVSEVGSSRDGGCLM